MKKYSVIVVVLAFLVSWVIGQEHPQEEASQKQAEHPTAEQSQEHPSETVEGQEHPAEQPQEHEMMLSTQVVNKDNLEDAIRRYIAAETAKGEGSFLFVDDKTGETLKLVIKKVHDERLAALGDNTFFACADFKTPDGKVYDLDIFMKGKTVNDLAPMEVTVHKEEGVERYTWAEVEGIWHKVAIEKKEE
jgi:uncharacterized protein involved in copper resistance